MTLSAKKEERKQIEKKKITQKEEKDQVKAIILRIKKDFINLLKQKSKEHKTSLNAYVNSILNSSLKKEEPIFIETITRPEKKEVESRIFFTISEMELLKKYAGLNEWSVSREVRYRVIASLSKKPKLSGEEFRAIYSVRSSINILGANLNRLIRNNQVLSDCNIGVCIESAGKSSYGYSVKPDYSREVMFKLTGGARSKKGIKNAVEYISKEWQEEIIDSNGISYKTKDEIESAVKILQENVATNVKTKSTKKVKLTHNMMFSAPRIAGVKKEDALEAVRAVLKEKYPDNYFVMAYHNETKNPHVHVILNINNDKGQRIDIKNKVFHEIRENFCKKLVEFGYDVKATRKYDLKDKRYEEGLSRENRNIYEVVGFGSSSYQLNKSNSKNNYLTYKTLNKNAKDITIWGAEITAEIARNNIKIGDRINIEKVGQVAVKVPVYGSDGTSIISWKPAHRNKWSITKANSNDNIIKPKQEFPKEIKLDTPEQAAKHLLQRQKFNNEKKFFLSSLFKGNFEPKKKIQLKQETQKVKFNY